VQDGLGESLPVLGDFVGKGLSYSSDMKQKPRAISILQVLVTHPRNTVNILLYGRRASRAETRRIASCSRTIRMPTYFKMDADASVMTKDAEVFNMELAAALPARRNDRIRIEAPRAYRHVYRHSVDSLAQEVDHAIKSRLPMAEQ
jgi:hypothetical protein